MTSGKAPEGDPEQPAPAHDLAESERFVVRRALARGSCGLVYEAFDRERGCDVAVKVFDRDVAAAPRFRDRLRSLCAISHPGLVQLHELVEVGGALCCVLELLPGPDLLTACAAQPSWRPGGERGRAAPQEEALVFERLRRGVAQVAAALDRLHGAGLFHGALVPNNVLLDQQGNVRLLDFGWRDLLEEVRPDDRGAPDRFAAHRVGDDLFGLGALLYVALTGLHPGPGSRQPSERRRAGPAGSLPADLDQLCAELLDPDPTRRPAAAAVAGRLVSPGLSPGSTPGLTAGLSPGLASSHAGALIGRDTELERLRAGLQRAAAGEGSLLWLRGQSGVGKSALVSAFIAGARADGALAFVGRSYRHETVPFKVVRDLVSQLAHHLAALPPEQRAAYRAALPEEQVGALLRLFPELSLAATPPEGARWAGDEAEPARVRRLGFAALRTVLAEVALAVPTVLFCDDLQWGEADSAALFAELVRPPMPPYFVIASYRSEGVELSPFLQALSQGALARGDELVLRGLAHEHATALAERWLGAALLPERAAAETLARGSLGNPLVLGTLARYVVRGGGVASSRDVPRTLSALLEQELRSLPPDAQRVLELIAVAERPIARDVLSNAAELWSGERANPAALERALGLLEAEGLVRLEGSAPSPWIDVAHDAVRGAVLASLADQQRDTLRRALVRSLERLPPGRSESAAVLAHFRALHDERAAGYAFDAGVAALDQMAFDRAARLLKLALSLGGSRIDEGLVRMRLGDALRLLGRGAEAAGEYLEAIRRGGGLGRVVPLQLQAAEQLLVSGHSVRGLRVLKHVFRSLSLGEPDATRPARRITLERAWRRARRFVFEPVPEERVPAEALHRVDALWTGASGLRAFDPQTAERLQAEHLVLALRAGEPRRVARAMALEVFSSAAGGTRSAPATERLLRRATALAEQLGDPESLARAALAAVVAALGLGEWQQAVRIARQCEALLRERTGGLVWERSTNQDLLLQGLNGLGDFAAIREQLPRMLQDARARDDRYAQGLFGIWRSRMLLMEDRPLEALEAVREIDQRFALAPFWFPRLNARAVECEIALYRQDPEVWELLAELDRQPPVRAQQARIRFRVLWARAAMLRARLEPAARAGLLRFVEHTLRTIERERAPWGNDLARALRGGLFAANGRNDEAIAAYREVERSSRERRIDALAEMCRFRQGELVAGEEGAAMCLLALAALERAGVAAPRLLCDLFVPRV